MSVYESHIVPGAKDSTANLLAYTTNSLASSDLDVAYHISALLPSVATQAAQRQGFRSKSCHLYGVLSRHRVWEELPVLP